MVRGRTGGLLGWLAGVLVAASRVATADPIVDRNYAIELYEGVAIGDGTQTGMGGAGAARVNGSAGTLLNPSAPAVRRSTDTDHWSWDYHLDFLTGRFSSDYDNNGIPAKDGSGAQLATFGVSLRFGDWAGAVTATAQTAPVDGSMPELDARAIRGKLVFARYFQRADLAVGLGIQTVAFELAPSSGTEPSLFSMTGAGAVGGATWLPREQSFRVGLALESRIVGAKVDTASCDPMSCQGYILPDSIESPGRVIAGAAYRWGPTVWNQLIHKKFRDERSLTVASDLVITGTSVKGNGLEGFGQQELQRSGRRITVSVRGGAEYEWLPGRLRVRAGSYWEPGRFDDVGGRIHATVGFDVRALEFQLWGVRRGRLGATADIASRYRNIGVSVGFWH